MTIRAIEKSNMALVYLSMPYTKAQLSTFIDAIDAALLARVTGDKPESFTIEGKSLTKISTRDLEKMRQNYMNEYQAKVNQESVEAGTGNLRRIKTKFV